LLSKRLQGFWRLSEALFTDEALFAEIEIKNTAGLKMGDDGRLGQDGLDFVLVLDLLVPDLLCP
jgi:hypothetical protein